MLVTKDCHGWFAQRVSELVMWYDSQRMDMSADTALALLDEAHSRDPRLAPYGLFVRDPEPVGIGMFFWYASEQDRLTSLLDVHHRPAEEDEQWPAVRKELALVLDSLAPLRPASVGEIGDLTQDHYCVEWWGTLDDLVSGQDPWAIEVRGRFRSDIDEESPRLISTAELDAFVAMLAEYGF